MTPSFDSLSAPKSRFRAIPPADAVLYALIALGCALRIYNVVVHNPLDHLWSDPLRHWNHAREPLVPSPMALFDPPVYQTWLSVLQRVTMGIPGLVAIFIAALSVITPWCWYRFLRETLSSRTLALAGWALLALLPTWIGIYSYFMMETLFLPALGTSLWLTMRAKRKMTTSSFVLMVATWTFCGLTRPIAIPLAAVAAAFAWFGHPQKLRAAAWSTLLIVVALAPISFRNHFYYESWAPHGNIWINKIYMASGAQTIELHLEKQGAHWDYGFGSPSVGSRPFAPLSEWTSQRTGTVHVNVDFRNGTRDWEKAYEATSLHGGALWRMRAESWIYLFFGNSWPDNNPEYFMGRLANLSRWLWAPLTLAVALFALPYWRQLLQRPLLPLVIAAWLFCQGWMLVVPGEGRYRKPYEGLLIAQALLLLDLRRRNDSGSIKTTPGNTPDSSVPQALP
jgi:4-amino-4-deoxy-L-arabinose transferase-like glycosyltransferase